MENNKYYNTTVNKSEFTLRNSNTFYWKIGDRSDSENTKTQLFNFYHCNNIIIPARI